MNATAMHSFQCWPKTLGDGRTEVEADLDSGPPLEEDLVVFSV